jgi:hypothetical protein
LGWKEAGVFWLALVVLIVAVVLAVGVGLAAYVTHLRDHAPSCGAQPGAGRGAAGVHRVAGAVGRHRVGGGLSVARLRAREHAEGMRMYPGGGGRW